jgi:hypothetical protein
MLDARFVRGSETLVAPISLDLADRGRVARTFASAREADIAALMASGIVKATAGSVFIGEFDPHIQPVQCKRLAGHVPHEIVSPEFASFEQYIEYRAALGSINRERAIAHGKLMLEQLEGVHESFAFPLIGSLIASPQLLVLDRPLAVYAPQILAATSACAVFSVHTSPREAEAFA